MKTKTKNTLALSRGGNVYNNENKDGSYNIMVASVFTFNPVSVFVFVSAPSLWEGRGGVLHPLSYHR